MIGEEPTTEELAHWLVMSSETGGDRNDWDVIAAERLRALERENQEQEAEKSQRDLCIEDLKKQLRQLERERGELRHVLDGGAGEGFWGRAAARLQQSNTKLRERVAELERYVEQNYKMVQVLAKEKKHLRERLEAENAQLRADSERLEWWFDDNGKDPGMYDEYIRGVSDGWSVNQWRAFIDRHREKQAQGGGGVGLSSHRLPKTLKPTST